METRQLLEIQKKQIPRMNIVYFWYAAKSWKTMESVIFRISLWKQSIQWTFNLLDEILKKIEIEKNITTAWKSILILVKLQCLVVKCCKL